LGYDEYLNDALLGIGPIDLSGDLIDALVDSLVEWCDD